MAAYYHDDEEVGCSHMEVDILAGSGNGAPAFLLQAIIKISIRLMNGRSGNAEIIFAKKPCLPVWGRYTCVGPHCK